MNGYGQEDHNDIDDTRERSCDTACLNGIEIEDID